MFDRSLLLALNIHIELNNRRFSLTHLKDKIRQETNRSLIASINSHSLVEESISCVKYYCHQMIELIEYLRETIKIELILNEFEENSRLCLNIFDQYETNRVEAVRDVLENPIREDAWHIVYELDSNMFVKCRIILIRLRTSFLVLHRFLSMDSNQLSSMRKRRSSTVSLTPIKREKT